MKRFRWDKKYLHWGVTAFLVIAAAIVFYMIVNHLGFLGGALRSFGRIISPFIWGLVIAYLLYPLMRIYQRGIFQPLWKFLLKKNKKADKLVPKLSRGFSVFLAIISLLVILTGLVWLVAPQMYNSIETIIVNSSDYVEQADAWISRFFANNPELEATLSNSIGDMSKGLVTWATNNLLPEFRGLLTDITSGVFSFAKGIYNIIIGMIVSIYVLYSRELFSARSKKLLYAVFSLEAAEKILNAIHFTNDVFQGYISGKILDSLIIGILCYIGCVVLRLEYAVLVSFIVGVTNIIPFFGPFIGAIPSALIILTISPMHALVFVIFIVLLQQFDGNILGPKILGNRVGINGFWVMFSILVGAGLFGFGGMLLGVPVFVVIFTFIRNLVDRKLRRSGLPVDAEEFKTLDHFDPKSGEPVPITDEKRAARRRRRFGLGAKKEETAKVTVSPEPSEAEKEAADTDQR
ncbi:MAG: AI-2E family transporter [Ruminococcaceae bacterium]|nr:AI-2E family transporter [Oscillospiraceae bacterium]